MEKKIKLRPKQLATLGETATKRQQLNTLTSELNKQENLVIELIMEENDITGKVDSVDISGEFITFKMAEPKAVAKKVKEKKLEVIKD